MTTALGVSMSSQSSGNAEHLAVFGGRQAEGEQLLRAHERLMQAGGGALLLTGPKGVGKSALLSGMRQALLRAGRGPVFQGSAAGQHRPYGMLADALRDALGHLDGLGAGQDVRTRHQAALALIDAGLLTRPETAAPPASRLGFQEATLSLVKDILTRTGATLVLADLEDGQEDTRALCAYLGQHLSQGPSHSNGVLVMGATEGSGLDTALDGAPVERVRVGGLDRDGLLRFLRNSSAVDRLLSASGGRPGDVDELLAALPLDLGTLLQARLDRLGDKARTVAQALSICDAPMGVDAVSAMTGLPAPALAPALAGLCEDGLAARRVANGALLFNLVRPAHAERLRQTMPQDVLARLHRALGEHLEVKGAGLMEGGEAHLAEHFLAAGDGVQGVAYALSASERLTVTHAYGAAIDLLTRALPLAGRLEDRQAILSRRAELHQLRGALLDALRDAGRAKALFPVAERGPHYRKLGELLTETGRPRVAVRQLERALGLLRDGPEGNAELGYAQAALAEAHYVAGDRDASAARAQDALARPGMTEALRIRIRNTLGKLALAKEDWGAAHQLFQDNRDSAGRHGLPAEVTRAEINLGVMSFRRSQYDQAELHLGRALKLAEEQADLPFQAFCVLNLGSLKHQRRDLGAALRLHHESLALFTKMGNRAEMARARLNVANLSTVLGDFSAAQDHVDRAGELLNASGLTAQQAYLAALEGDLHLAGGRPGQALERYEASRQLFAGMGQRGRAAEERLRSAQAALRARDLSTAEEALSHLSASREDLDHPRLRAEAMLTQARLHILTGATGADVQARVTALLEEARTQLAAPADPEVVALLSFVEAELWAARGDTRRSERLASLAKDALHKVAAELPPNLRDGYVRSRILFLGPVATAVTARRQDTTELQAVTTDGTTTEIPGARSDAWNQRYAAMVGDSTALLKVFARLDRLHGTTSTVLIRGESGTGKELVANALHTMSPRASGPFIKVNCAALVETLLLSELFGHEKGAFTGAHQRKVGRFELARGGTIFLDEIGDISAKTQVSLLRVLQERVFERVGGATPIKTDCRVICATNRNLEAMVKAGTFREDLYYRLKGMVVDTPALRERRPDISALVGHVAKAAALEMGRAAPRFSVPVLDVLTRYDWPGNIRELENTVRSLVLFADGDTVEPAHLAEFKEFGGKQGMGRASTHGDRATSQDSTSGGTPSPGVPLGQMKKQLEFEAISKALEDAKGNISRAADLLQMKRPRLSQIVNGNPALRTIKERWRAEGEGGAA